MAEAFIANVVSVYGVAASEMHTELELRCCSRWPGKVFYLVMYRVAI